MKSIDALLVLLRLWAEEFISAQNLGSQLSRCHYLNDQERQFAKVFFQFAANPQSRSATELAQFLQTNSNRLTMYQTRFWQYPIVNQQVAIYFAQAAACMHAQPQTSIGLYGYCLNLLSDFAPAYLYRGLLYANLKQIPQALQDLKKACQSNPNWLQAWQEYIQLLVQCRDWQSAQQACQEALQHVPESHEIWLLAGNLSQSTGNLAQAEQSYRQALDLKADIAGIWSNLGFVCHQQLRPLEALPFYQKALELDPGLVESWNNLATLQMELGQYQEAEQSLNHCLKLHSGYYPAWVNRGLITAIKGNQDLAHVYFEQARQLNPHRLESWQEEARLFFSQKQDQQAFALLESGIQKVSDPSVLHMILGRNLSLRHQGQKGSSLMNLAIQKHPEQRFWQFLNDLGSAEAYFCQDLNSRQDYIHKLTQMIHDYSEKPFAPAVYLSAAQYLPLESLWNLFYLDHGPFKELKQAFSKCFELIENRPGISKHTGPIKLGVVVTAHHEGIFLKMSGKLLQGMPKDDFEICLFGNPQRLSGLGLTCLALPQNLVSAARLIRSCELDILYFWEIGSDSSNFLLPYFQSAPIQFTSWGTPITTGSKAIDYYLSTRLLDLPNPQDQFSEELLLCDYLPTVVEDPDLIAGQKNRQEMGLPAEGTLYFCHNNPLKITPEYAEILLEILQKDPDSHLILLSSQIDWINQSLGSIRDILRPVQDRVHWQKGPLSRPDFLNLMACADLALDTTTCAGGQVSHEALLMGLPIISWPQSSQHSRLTLTRYQAMDLDLGIAQSREEYIQLALYYSQSTEQRQLFREKIQNKREALLLNQEPTEAFSQLIWQMAYQRGLR